MTANLIEGMSGGPVLDKQGDLIGMAFGGADDGSGFTFFTPIIFGRNLLGGINVRCSEDHQFTTAVIFPEGAGSFNLGDNNVATLTEFPICTISGIEIERSVLDKGAACTLKPKDGIWVMNVNTNSFCKATCFK
jgi:hypothetical protein